MVFQYYILYYQPFLCSHGYLLFNTMHFTIKPWPILLVQSASKLFAQVRSIRNIEALFNYRQRNRRLISIDFAGKDASTRQRKLTQRL